MSIVQFEYLYHYIHTSRRFIQEHNHSCYELVYYYDGTGETQIDRNTVYKYQPYTYAIYKPYDLHTETHYDSSSVFCIGFHLESRCPFKLEAGVYEDMEKSVWGIIKKIRSEISLKNDFYNIAVELYTSQIAIIHQRRHGKKASPFDSMNYIYKFLDENFAQDINIDTLVEMSGYSYDYFRHLFKEAVGVSPNNYILDKRIGYAKQLLADGRSSVSEIAGLCGFQSSSQFAVIFKKRTGMPPLQYRKDFRKYQELGIGN